MYPIGFYEDARSRSPVLDLIKELDRKAVNDKDARIKLQKITYQLHSLELVGTRASEYIVKHVRDEIWELRPGDLRILFYLWRGQFILLHWFVKKTGPVPERDIRKAKNSIIDWENRYGQ